MLPKRNRLRAADFKGLRGARIIHSPHFFVRLARNGKDTPAKLAAVVSARVGRTATARNLLRRRVYAALDEPVRRGNEFLLVVTAKAGAGALSFEEMKQELLLLLEKGGVLQKARNSKSEIRNNI